MQATCSWLVPRALEMLLRENPTRPVRIQQKRAAPSTSPPRPEQTCSGNAKRVGTSRPEFPTREIHLPAGEPGKSPQMPCPVARSTADDEGRARQSPPKMFSQEKASLLHPLAARHLVPGSCAWPEKWQDRDHIQDSSPERRAAVTLPSPLLALRRSPEGDRQD